MFWAKTAAIYQIFTKDLSEYYPNESAKKSFTIMHAIERIWLYLVKFNDAFASIYRFFARYIESYKVHACKVLFNFSILKDVSEIGKKFDEMMADFGNILVNILRKSDVMVQSKPNQFMLLLPEVDEEHLENVLDRI